MAKALQTVLITAIWYGGLAALLIFVVAPWLHSGAGYALKDNVSLAQYQQRAVISAAIGYPLLCAVIIWADAAHRKNNRPEPRSLPTTPR